MSMRAKEHPIEAKKQPNWMPNPSWKYHPGNDCDVTLKTGTPNGREFRAHKAVLCAASKYFQVLFSDRWKGASRDAITLPGITDVNFETLLGR